MVGSRSEGFAPARASQSKHPVHVWLSFDSVVLTQHELLDDHHGLGEEAVEGHLDDFSGAEGRFCDFDWKTDENSFFRLSKSQIWFASTWKSSRRRCWRTHHRRSPLTRLCTESTSHRSWRPPPSRCERRQGPRPGFSGTRGWLVNAIPPRIIKTLTYFLVKRHFICLIAWRFIANLSTLSK